MFTPYIPYAPYHAKQERITKQELIKKLTSHPKVDKLVFDETNKIRIFSNSANASNIGTELLTKYENVHVELVISPIDTYGSDEPVRIFASQYSIEVRD